jgi:hypothetical protein
MAKKRPKRPRPHVAKPATVEEMEWYERELRQMRLPLEELGGCPAEPVPINRKRRTTWMSNTTPTTRSSPSLSASTRASISDRSLAKVGERARYTARCGGYFGEPKYIVLLDVHDAAGALVARSINGNSWKGDASTNGSLFDGGEAPSAGDLLDFTARLVDWRQYNDGCAPFTFEDMDEAEVTRRRVSDARDTRNG